jgi:hydrogenase nickel incorporation protein HypB
MCEECGCGDIDHGNVHEHGHSHDHDGQHGHAHSHGSIPVGREVLEANSKLAERNRALFDHCGLFVMNLISSPGAGKTSILEHLAQRFGDTMAVIEGDIQTRRDAERVIRAGSRACQIETRGACHLDAHAVAHALDDLDVTDCKLLIIENVGNLVCPATYELGEHEKAAILSVPEGDDKILKYPALFHRAHVLLINKIDLVPHVRFDTSKAVNEGRSLNRQVSVFEISAETGQGMDAFGDYLAAKAGI